jgi:hypothetical protein
MAVTQGSHVNHLNGYTLVTRGAPICIQAAILVTQGFHLGRPIGSNLGTQRDPLWSPKGIHFRHPRTPVWVAQGGSLLSPKGSSLLAQALQPDGLSANLNNRNTKLIICN